MKKKEPSETPNRESDNRDNKENEGYPLYPPSDDIYSRFKEEQDIDPEDPTKTKEPVPEIDTDFEPDVETDDEEIPEIDLDIIPDDLDIPGSELDDDQEDIGNEDEENNYYSIGGDNHHDLEEHDADEDEIDI